MTDNVVKLPGARDPAREDLVDMFEGFLQLAKDGELDTAIVAARTAEGNWIHELSASLNFREHIGGLLLLLLETALIPLQSMDRDGRSG